MDNSFFEKYTDVYFLRSVEILQKMHLDPYIRAQIFFRGGGGKIGGIQEIIQLIQSTTFFQNGGKLFALSENDAYQPEETVVMIEGKAGDVIPLETVILGILSAETTKKNDHHDVDLQQVERRFNEITQLVKERPVFYFGARHWRYDQDEEIAKAAFLGGAAGASTQAGASAGGRKGVGTIPHSLENIFAWKYGTDNAVLESTKAFDQYMDSTIPRIALIDYANKEVEDALMVAKMLQGKLSGVRVDTAGENTMQGASKSQSTRPFWSGNGVTISGIINLRNVLNQAGYNNISIFLSSGFGDVEKVKAFVEAERELGQRLFDSLGVGNVFNARIATMDVVGVGESIEDLQPISKVGRRYKPNQRIQHVIL